MKFGVLAKQKAQAQEVQRMSGERALKDADRQLENLTKLRVRDLITDEEYLRQRQELERERIALSQTLQLAENSGSWFEPAKLLFSFSNRAVSCFQGGDLATKRLIVEIVGLNPTVLDGKLNIEAKKPFRCWTTLPKNTDLCSNSTLCSNFFQSK